ncbi:hypothetical protein A4X06_0g50 [Tilletia controversa]|uniref:COG complex component COG2 C-terminal domain-containing protein n=1 Tax=Tilletia controversa TaxID=13291 RepID=A0A8X7N278_9BASI|nr:hypothetical protein CF328_g447 [Tilletia controversa]KAE8256141.1 hypothetical protein A4X06_0g50 [Tilletia controversa]
MDEAEREQQHRRGRGSGGKAGGGAGGHSSSNSLERIGANFASLQLAPLSLAEPHPLLASSSTGDFDPDEFLCSRATGTKLSSILAELEAHHDELQQHLISLVQSHTGVFRDVAAAVQEDAATVEQLGQVNFAANAARRSTETRSRTVSGSQSAGMHHVQRVFEQTRDKLHEVKTEVDAVMEERKLCMQVQSQLSVLLALHQCILRLESLLGIPASSFERRRTSNRAVPSDSTSTARKSSATLRLEAARREDREADEDEEEDEADAILESMGGLTGHGGMHGLGGHTDAQHYGAKADVEAELLGLFSQAAEDVFRTILQDEASGFDAMVTAVSSISNSSSLSDPQRSPKSRRKSLAAVRRSSSKSISMSEATAALWQTSGGPGFSAALSIKPKPKVLPLPQRLAKAMEELLQLITLINRALDEDLRMFINARIRRLNGIGSALAGDLKVLLSQLLGPTSLIFHPPDRLSADDLAELSAVANGSRDSLSGWTQVDADETSDRLSVVERRRDEQYSWLHLSLRAYTALDSLFRSTASMTPESTLPTSAGLRDDLNATLRTGVLSRWIHDRIRSSSHTQLIKYSAEPGTAARGPRMDTQGDAFPTPATSTPQISPMVVSETGASPEEESDLKSSEALRKVYNEILRFLTEDAQGFFAASQSALCVESDWYIDSFGVAWDEISRALLEDLGNVIFFVGRPNSFQQNYNITARFLQLVAQLVPSPIALRNLHDHPGFIAFQKRWQLSVYFRIRLRNTVTALEAGLSSGLSPVHSRGSSNQPNIAQLQAVQATYEAFATPWRSSVHIRPLTAREWTLSLQVISRFKTWLETEVLSEATNDVGGGADAHSAGHGQNSQVDRDGSNGHRRTPSSSSRIGGTGRDSPNLRSRIDSPAQGESRAQQEAYHRRLLRWTWIASDVEWLDRSLWDVYEADIVPAVRAGLAIDPTGRTLPSIDGVLKEMNDALRNALSYRRGFVSVLGRNIVTLLKQRCAASFEILNRTGSITRQYRAGGSGSSAAGSVPSQTFVGQMIAPLQEYFGTTTTVVTSGTSAVTKEALSRIDLETRVVWAQDVVDDIVSRYASALFTMNKTLESLRRLKRGSTTLGFGSLFGGGAPAQPVPTAAVPPTSDGAEKEADPESRRTRKQMQADVDVFEAEVRALGGVGVAVVLEGREAWERLKRAADGCREG